MIDRKNVFDHSVKNNKATYDNIRKLATGQGDDYTTGYLLDYIYLDYIYLDYIYYFNLIAVDLSKRQALDGDPMAIQQINFTENLDRAGKTRFYLILEEAK